MHEEAIRKADVLIEALGYIRKFHGKFTVIKLGGSVMEDPESLPRPAGRRRLHADRRDAAGGRPRRRQGDHRGDGAGRARSPGSSRAGATPTRPTLEIVARVLAEEINADIVRHINKFGGRASGLHHKTAPVPLRPSVWPRRRQRRLDRPGPRRRGDRGRRAADREPLPGGRRPGAPLAGRGRGRRGQLLNVNADTAAAAVARRSRPRSSSS